MSYSIVEYCAEHEKYKCGYCKSVDTNYSHGLWAYALTVADYQDLIDRGWRRSGKYCYKPTLEITCCPMYTIRCHALDFKLSKSQKKVIKKFNKFLSGEGESKNINRKMSTNEDDSDICEGNDCFMESKHIQKGFDLNKEIRNDNANHDKVESFANNQGDTAPPKDLSTKTVIENVAANVSSMDRGGGPCKKAKLLRIQRKTEKLKAKGIDPKDVPRKECNQNPEKTLEEFLDNMPEGAKSRLKIRLVRTAPSSKEWEESSNESHALYVKYQMAIHGDKLEKCDKKQYESFLVQSPLKELYDEGSIPSGYGSFQQQYFIDDKMVAVGIIDILPLCVSSVYFYYDPDYSYLSFGTYGALREVAFVRQLHTQASKLKYYYMGYYIHSCKKMRYKGNLKPSDLLCPETYKWFGIEQAIPKLEKHPYSRLNEDLDALDDNDVCDRDIDHILVVYNQTIMPYYVYQMKKGSRDGERDELTQYAKLVGKKLTRSLLLLK